MDTDVSPLHGCVLPPVYSRSGEAGGAAMETADSMLTRQIQAVDRSMVFLRQEHLTLLHGLHLEILSLQKRCSELTTEYEVKPPGRSQMELQQEEEILEIRCRDVESRLAEQQCTLGELRQELSHKGSLVGALRAALKEKERRFLDELKRRSHRSTSLNSELQRQTESAAHLSFQLHAARQKLHQQRMLQRQGLLLAGRANSGSGGHHHQGGGGPQYRSNSHHQGGPQYRSNQGVYGSNSHQGGPQHRAERQGSVTPPQWLSPTASPSPASSPVAVKPKRRSARSASGHALRLAERSRECVPVERVMGPAEPTAMPDPALFLHPSMRRPRARSRHHSSSSPAQRRGPLPGTEREDGEEGGGEGPVTPQQDGGVAPRLVSAVTAPPAAEAQAD